MSKRKSSKRLLGKQVWCVGCLEDQPPKIKKADHLIPIRDNPYTIIPDGNSIDKRVMGVCKKCLKSKNQFQQDNTNPVDVNNKNIVLRHI